MTFYCVYCNRMRGGKKNSPQGKTSEHFIPKSIGGKWTVKVCGKCNSLAGATCDLNLAKISWLYEFYAKGILETEGKAILLPNNVEIPARFKYQQKLSINHNQFHYQQKQSINHNQFHYCYCLNSGKKIPKEKIRGLRFKLEKITSIATNYPAFLKIALGGAYYLTKRYGKWFNLKQVFYNSNFAALREKFLGKNNFTPGDIEVAPGGIGVSLDPKLQSLSLLEIESLLKDRDNPEHRRHIISIEGKGGHLEIIMCLFSMFFWKVNIPNAHLILEKVEDETILYGLSKVKPSEAGNLMHYNRDDSIVITLNDS